MLYHLLDIPADQLIQTSADFRMRADQVRAAWELLQPVITAWDEIPATDFPNYAAGSWGPEAAERLIAAGGDAWLVPTL